MKYCKDGGLIKGKVKVPGDSEENDTVSIKVSPGEVVIPRTVVEQGHEAMAEFAKKAMAEHHAKVKFSSGGQVEPSVWDNIKSSFDEEKPKPKKEVPKLDQDKAKSFSSVFNTDKYNEGGVVTKFDPAAYLAKKTGTKTDTFDPAAYLAKKTGAAPEESILDKEIPIIGGTARGYTKGLLNTLPTAGMIGGGMIGGVAGGTAGSIVPGAGTAVGAAYGSVGGAGLGAAGGEALKKLGERYVLNEDPETREKYYGDVAKAVPEGMASEAGGQIIGKTASLAAQSKVGQKVGGMLSSAKSKIGETLTGVPAKEIETYSKHADEIKAMVESSDNSTAEAADQMRDKFSNNIKQTRQSLSGQIDPILKNSPKRVDAKPIVDALENAKARIDADYYPEQIKQVDDLLSTVKKKIDDGTMTAFDAHQTKLLLQEKASSAYSKPGDIFSIGTEAAKAAKSGAAQARVLVNEAEPAIAGVNNQLSHLHDIEDTMNANLISKGKPEAGLLAAGAGGNSRNVKTLTDLGEATGTDMLGDAQKLAAMRTFGNPSWNPASTTGKTLLHAGKGAVLGGAAGYAGGGKEGAMAGALLGGMATSPASLKMAIDSGKLTQKMLSNPQVQTMLGKGLLKTAESYFNKGE